MTVAAPAPDLLRVENLSRRFPGVIANDRLSFAVRRGEVHAILGENGAGKSTLMNILFGLLAPDEGTIFWKGEPVQIGSPGAAIALGIGMVHQHFMLAPSLTVLENVILGIGRGLRFNLTAAEKRLRTIAEEFEQPIDPHAKVGRLSVGERQRIEILKALYRNAELLILDEPTAALTPQEADALFAACRRIIAQGRSVVFITHKLAEIMATSDRVTVLRGGRNVGTVDTRSSDPLQLARMMVGTDVPLGTRPAPREPGPVILSLEDLGTAEAPGVMAVKNVSFDIAAGEILGIAGVDGNGQTEMAEAILGLRPLVSGRVVLHGRDLAGMSLAERMSAGLAFVPADRHAAAMVGDFDLVENALLSFDRDPAFASSGIVRRRALVAFTDKLIREYRVQVPSAQVRMDALSGGNQQRFVMGRALAHDPHLMLAVQPTRGLDLASSEFVLGRLVSLRDQSRAVLLISMDLDEILRISDRIAVIYRGRMLDIVTPDIGRERLGLLMAGERISA